jgi:hypothetical protein
MSELAKKAFIVSAVPVAIASSAQAQMNIKDYTHVAHLSPDSIKNRAEHLQMLLNADKDIADILHIDTDTSFSKHWKDRIRPLFKVEHANKKDSVLTIFRICDIGTGDRTQFYSARETQNFSAAYEQDKIRKLKPYKSVMEFQARKVPLGNTADKNSPLLSEISIEYQSSPQGTETLFIRFKNHKTNEAEERFDITPDMVPPVLKKTAGNQPLRTYYKLLASHCGKQFNTDIYNSANKSQYETLVQKIKDGKIGFHMEKAKTEIGQDVAYGTIQVPDDSNAYITHFEPGLFK